MLDKKIYINSIAGISPSMANKGFENVGEPDYKEFIQDAGSRRRMSRIIRMGVASALMCIKESGSISIDGIITGTGWGCLNDTEKFLISILENNERMLNPTSFIQSTSNTIGAQVALLMDTKSYNNTFVHGGTSFEASLIDAMLLLQEESKKHVLVGGFDELTPTKDHLLKRMGVWRNSTQGEGAHFFTVSNQLLNSSIAQIESIKTFHEDKIDTILKEEAALDIEAVLCGINRLGINLSETFSTVIPFKDLCGEYPTATAFALWLACKKIREVRDGGKIMIINQHLKDQVSIIVIRRI